MNGSNFSSYFCLQNLPPREWSASCCRASSSRLMTSKFSSIKHLENDEIHYKLFPCSSTTNWRREEKQGCLGREVRPTWQNWSHSTLQRTFLWELIVKDSLIFWSSISSNRSHAKTWKSRYHSAACRRSVFIVNTIFLMRQFDLITISINMQYCYWSTSSCKSTRGVV
jgi:hypothetical protein